MGHILIDTRDLRGTARDLRGTAGALGDTRAVLDGAFRTTWFGPSGGGFQRDWANRAGWIARMGEAVTTSANGIDAYATQVDAEQARTNTRFVTMPWTMRPLKVARAAFLAIIRGAMARCRGAFTRMAKMLKEMLHLLDRGLRRIAGTFVAWGKRIWGCLKTIGAVVLGVVTFVGITLTVAYALPFLPLLQAANKSLWRQYASAVPASTAHWATPLWTSLAKPGESVLDRSSRWLGEPVESGGLQAGQFGVIDKGNGEVLIVMRGLDASSWAGNSPAEVAFEQYGYGPYTAQVEAEILRLKSKYPNLTVSFIGHSEGGMAARNIVADSKFWSSNGIRFGAAVTIDSPVDMRTGGPGIDMATQVFQFNNKTAGIHRVGVSDLDGVWSAGSVQGDTRVEIPSDQGHAPDQFVGGAHMTPEQKAEWVRAGNLFSSFEHLDPRGIVYVAGR